MEQLDKLAAYYASRASESVSNGDLSIAMNLLARAVTANPEFLLLGSVREEIRQATSLQAEIESMLQDASGLRVKGSLIEPPTLNAAEIYHQVLATDPDNTIAIHDAGGSRGYMTPFWVSSSPRSFVAMGGMAPMGWSLGAAIGSKLGCPEKLVVHLFGSRVLLLIFSSPWPTRSERLPITCCISALATGTLVLRCG